MMNNIIVRNIIINSNSNSNRNIVRSNYNRFCDWQWGYKCGFNSLFHSVAMRKSNQTSVNAAVHAPLYTPPEVTQVDINRHVMVALVDNEPGVLAKVAGMFAARNFNIDSLVVGRTSNPKFSRICIVVRGETNILNQALKQMSNLVDVWKVVDYKAGTCIERDLALVKVRTYDIRIAAERRESIDRGFRPHIQDVCNMFSAKVVHVTDSHLTLELVDLPNRVEAFIEILKPYGIEEVARTGVIAMGALPYPRPKDQTPSKKDDSVDPASLPPG